MKTKRPNALTMNLFSGIIALMMVFPFASFAKKIPFLNSTATPAARGYVKVKKDVNKNYVIKLYLSNLAEIERILPEKQTYVVWMVTDRELVKNIGRVKSSKNITNDLKGYFQTVSSFQPTKIFITTEVDESVQTPGEQVVLSTDRFWE